MHNIPTLNIQQGNEVKRAAPAVPWTHCAVPHRLSCPGPTGASEARQVGNRKQIQALRGIWPTPDPDRVRPRELKPSQLGVVHGPLWKRQKPTLCPGTRPGAVPEASMKKAHWALAPYVTGSLTKQTDSRPGSPLSNYAPLDRRLLLFVLPENGTQQPFRRLEG